VGSAGADFGLEARVTDVAWRDVWRGRVWRAQAFRVVRETSELLALWSPAGAPTKLPADGDGRRLRIPGEDWVLEDSVAKLSGLLVARPGAAHSLYHFYANGRFTHWYVNLEEPLRRSAVGWDTFDHKLDVVVSADRSWRLKDEDELEAAARLGLLDADVVRAEAKRVIASLDEFLPSGWESWRPDPAWRVPRLPPGWEVV
jgi:hypothetical protein